jgi:hypothetical protein
MNVKKYLPKKVLVLKQNVTNYFYLLDELVFFYKFNFKKMRQDNNRYLTQLTKTKFITSRSFLNIATIKNRYQEANSLTVNLEKNLPKKLVIYICSDALENFIEKTLNKISKPFILMTGNSDRTISREIKNIKLLINNKFLIKWYAQNLKLNHEKISYLPIGLDYHATFKSRNKYKSKKEFPNLKENQLIKISKSKIKKNFLMYSNWLFNLNKKRKLCLNQIDQTLVFFEKKKVSQTQSWKNMRKYAFCLCPEGYGIDTHRVWEAIIIGAIPVLKSSSLDNMYNKFPVIIVKNWKDVTKSKLLNEYNKINKKKYNYSSLYLNFWKKQLKINR